MFFIIFSCFWKKIRQKCLKLTKKRLKTIRKSISNSFLVPAAPKSWSKYTTADIQLLNLELFPIRKPAIRITTLYICREFHNFLIRRFNLLSVIKLSLLTRSVQSVWYLHIPRSVLVHFCRWMYKCTSLLCMTSDPVSPPPFSRHLVRDCIL